MSHWMCCYCGYYTQEAVAPLQCPGCAQRCAFVNVGCHAADCGGEGKVDYRLLASYGRQPWPEQANKVT